MKAIGKVGARLFLGLCLLTKAMALDYQDHATLTGQLNRLTGNHGQIAHLERAAVTTAGHEVWFVELGSGSPEERRRRPALLVVAGIEGNDLVGTVSVVEWMEHLASKYEQDDKTRELLDDCTLYCFPRLNPDAVESFFAKPKVERTTNNSPTDDDHDGLMDEDGPEDLNGDGLITWMRVEDPEGEFILDPADSRLLIKADKAKGEKGVWKLFTEGVDNDKDEQWNEDGLGGVNLNHNFPFGYQYFAVDSGRHQVSEIETRALADFVVAHPNIAVAFTFGAADNLVQTPKADSGNKRPPIAISETDVGFYRELGRVYRESLGLKKELTGTSEPGSFSDWIYFDRGRLSLAARPWTPQLQIEILKEQKTEKAKEAPSSRKEDGSGSRESKEQPSKAPSPDAAKSGKESDDKTDKRGEEERAALKWFDENSPESFVRWREFKHPDFPNRKVEIGGWVPFATNNPPAKLLEELAGKHEKFLTDLARRLPRVGLRKAEAKHLGSGVYELTLQIENTGYLPTALAQGSRTREVLRTRVVLKLTDAQILTGQRITLLGPIAGSGGMEELRYTVRARSPVEVEIISALGGTLRRSIELKESL